MIFNKQKIGMIFGVPLGFVFLRGFRAFAVTSVIFAVGCVPIRQYMGGNGSAHSKSSGSPSKGDETRPEFQSPDEFRNADEDAWKDEMEGLASWYGADFNGRLTASGDVYDMYKFTAAHKTLPLGAVVKVINQDNGKSVEVLVNDRGPYVKGRIIDLSRTAGRAIDIRGTGTARVKLEIVHWPNKD